MVAYNFKVGFAPRIIDGTKRQTIRLPRKRHARPGEGVQLFTGMRTRCCRKLIDPDPICISVSEISFEVPPSDERMMMEMDGLARMPVDDLFAIDDGFRSAHEMMRWWRLTHGAGRFDGVLIKWGPQ